MGTVKDIHARNRLANLGVEVQNSLQVQVQVQYGTGTVYRTGSYFTYLPLRGCVTREYYNYYLEQELGPEEDVEESQEQEGGEAGQQASTQVQVLPVRGQQGGSQLATVTFSLGPLVGTNPDSFIYRTLEGVFILKTQLQQVKSKNKKNIYFLPFLKQLVRSSPRPGSVIQWVQICTKTIRTEPEQCFRGEDFPGGLQDPDPDP